MSKIEINKAKQDLAYVADSSISAAFTDFDSDRPCGLPLSRRALQALSTAHLSSGAGSTDSRERAMAHSQGSIASPRPATVPAAVDHSAVRDCSSELEAASESAAADATSTVSVMTDKAGGDVESVCSAMTSAAIATADADSSSSRMDYETCTRSMDVAVFRGAVDAVTATAANADYKNGAETGAEVRSADDCGAIVGLGRRRGGAGFWQQVAHTMALFLPLFMGQLAATSMGVADTLMAGAAGTLELSGVAIGSSVFWPAELFVVGMALAIHPLIANLVGAGSLDKVALRMQVACVCCLSCAAVVGVIIMLVPQIYLMFPETDQYMVAIGQGYLIATGLAMPGFALFNVLRAYWEGLGKTVPTLIFGCTALLLNIPLNYIFIFGKFGMPELGGIGCGVATAITIYLTSLLMLIYVKKSPSFAHVRIFERWLRADISMYCAFLKLSMPLGIAGMIETLCFSLVAILLSPFGPVTVASHTIAMNVSGMLAIVPIALSSTASIEVGEAMGSSNWKQARRRSLSALFIALSFYCAGATFLFTSGELIASWYSDDAEVLLLAPVLMLYCCVFFLPETLQVMATGILRGFKDSRSIFIVTIVAYWLIGMPVGFALGYGHLDLGLDGPEGFWLGFIISLSVAALMLCIRLVYIFTKRIQPACASFNHCF